LGYLLHAPSRDNPHRRTWNTGQSSANPESGSKKPLVASERLVRIGTKKIR
jgi:hypothetical protein